MDICKIKVRRCFSLGIIFLFFSVVAAQENNEAVSLRRHILELKTTSEAYPALEQLQALYTKDNRYTELIDFLKIAGAKNKIIVAFTNYHIAHARYQQLKYLEETQNWDEYFAKGNEYRDDITAFAEKTIQETLVAEPLHIYARLLWWRFHHDQQDAFSAKALDDLVQATQEYARTSVQDASTIQRVADGLSTQGLKGKAKQLYRLYVDKLVSTKTNPLELNAIASGFLAAGNLELAESIYDSYVEQLKSSATKKTLSAALINLARLFSYKDEGQNDPQYAEKMFVTLEEIDGELSFDGELRYLRAWNLEKMKDYLKAKDEYVKLRERYPETLHKEQVDFKIGMILVYVGRDRESGKSYFEKLASRETVTPYVLASLYQLGLLHQWQGDAAKATEYYQQLIQRAGTEHLRIKSRAQIRLKELEGGKDIEHNLKTFLEVSLKEEYPPFNLGKVEMSSSRYTPTIGQPTLIRAIAYAGESGCTPVTVHYLWSGALADAIPSLEQSEFSATYTYPGTQEINLVVVSLSGIIDRTLDFIDVK